MEGYDKVGIRLFSIAMVKKAIEDYELQPRLRGEIKAFFLSDWFDLINPLDVTGSEIIKILQSRHG